MKLTIFQRLTLGYLSILLLIILLGVYITLSLKRLNRTSHAVISVDSTIISISENLQDVLFAQEGFERKYLVMGDHDFYQKLQEIQADFSSTLERLKNLMDTPAKKKIFARLKKTYNGYLSALQDELVFVTNGQNYPYEKFQEEKERLRDLVHGSLKKLIQMTRLDRNNKLQALKDISSRVLNITTACAIIVILVGILISFINTRSINRPIKIMQAKTKEISRGTFEGISSISAPPEIEQLIHAFNSMCGRLKELEEMKADFMNQVSHEMRTPLTSITGASSLLLDNRFSAASKQGKVLLKTIETESERLIRSINSLLDLSRMEAEMMTYDFRESSIVPLIQDVVSRFSPIALRDGIGLELKISPGLSPVRMDENRIRHVIENLLGNALKFTSRGGNILVSAALKKNKKTCVEVSVSDTGPGIPEEDLKTIFDKFKRTYAGTKKTPGTGLGLSIAKHIVLAHRGEIWVESEVGKGSTFYFTLFVV